MTEQQLKLNIELEISEAIANKFPEADDVAIIYYPKSKKLDTAQLEKYLERYDIKYRLKVLHEFLVIINENVDKFNSLNMK